MIERERKNNILPYANLINKILNYNGCPFDEEEPIIQHIKIGQSAISKMGFTIKQGEFVTQQPRIRESRNIPSSSSNTNILAEQKNE
ncbi:hypothetical protein RYX36_021720 [Vicia faba]